MPPLNAILRENRQAKNRQQGTANGKPTNYNNDNDNNNNSNHIDRQHNYFLNDPSPILDTENLNIQELLDLDLRSYNNSTTKNNSRSEFFSKYRDPDIGILYNTNYKYIPDSPRLPPPSPPSSPSFEQVIDWDRFSLELIRTRRNHESFDCGPFFRARDYESVYDEEDVIELMIRGNGDSLTGPSFERELEYLELRDSVVGKWDYVLYHLFGVDRYGFFELSEKRRQSLAFPLRSCLQPLRYSEDEEEGNEGEDNNYSFLCDMN